MVTQRCDGTVAMAVWNLVDPGHKGTLRWIRFEFRKVKPEAQIRFWRGDAQHGNTLPAHEAMWRPGYPTPAQFRKMNVAAELPFPTSFL